MLQQTLFIDEEPEKSIILRPYQEECVKRVLSDFEKRLRKRVASLPTGSGKTFIALTIIKRFLEKYPIAYAIVIVPSIDLVHQTYRKALEIFPPKMLGMIQGPYNQTGKQVIIASIDTLARKNRREQVLHAQNGERFRCVVLDECHGCLSQKYQVVLADIEHPEALRIGKSATPYRHDKQSLYPTFPDGIGYYIHLTDLIAEGHLLPFEVYKVDSDLDFGTLRIEGLYNAEGEEVDQIPQAVLSRIKRSNRYGVALKAWQEIMQGERTIIFANDVRDAYGFASYFSEHGVLNAVITSLTDREDRKHIYQAYHEGIVRVLINVGVLTTGVDFIRTAGVILARYSWMGDDPNLSLITQAIGRATRPSDEIDSAGNPKKGAAKAIFLTTKQYQSIPQLFDGIDELIGRTDGSAGRSMRHAAIRAINRELGLDTDYVTYSPLDIHMKIQCLRVATAELFTSAGWVCHGDGTFTHVSEYGTLLVEEEGSALYRLSLVKGSKRTQIPITRSETESDPHGEPVVLRNAKDALLQGTQFLIRKRIQCRTPIAQTMNQKSNDYLSQEDRERFVTFCNRVHIHLQPADGKGMRQSHYQEIIHLFRHDKSAFTKNEKGITLQLCFDHGEVYKRHLQPKKSNPLKKERQHTVETEARDSSPVFS